MPWSETSPMDQKTQFIADFLRQYRSVTELCTEYGISRKTAYKWIDRYLRHGPAGLEERSRRPESSPNATPPEIVDAIVEIRHRHPSWGPKKILRRLQGRFPRQRLPHRATVAVILERRGLSKKKSRRRKIGHPGKPSTIITAPNDLWCADYKGHFKTRNGRYCYPLTVSDAHSRFLIGCQALLNTSTAAAKPVFTRLFQEFGLPKRIRTDNGTPFASTALARLSRLSAWWVRLGILPEFIEPGRPQQNGRHERMHKTLKEEATRPPSANHVAQQRRFNYFRKEFNHVRPHEALEMETPDTFYVPSNRPMPKKIPPLEYPNRFEVRYVSANGGIRWNSQWVNVSQACAGDYVGLEEIDNGVWNVFFGPLKLGRLLEQHLRIEDAYGRLKRTNR